MHVKAQLNLCVEIVGGHLRSGAMRVGCLSKRGHLVAPPPTGQGCQGFPITVFIEDNAIGLTILIVIEKKYCRLRLFVRHAERRVGNAITISVEGPHKSIVGVALFGQQLANCSH